MTTTVPHVGSQMSKAEYEQLAGFRYALRLFFSFSESNVREMGLTPRQYQTLLAIKGFPGRDEATITELAEQLQLKHNSTVELVDRLSAEGLVERKRGRTNRKQVYVVLTPRGESVLEKLAAGHKEQLRRLTPQLEAALRAISG